MERRGDHAVFTARESGVDLRAVTWNEGQKDKHGKIAKKNIVATCGTTLPAPPHFKRRWNVHESGTDYFNVPVKRPCIVRDYFCGAEKIDVHNHLRQGGLALEKNATRRWEFRFFQTFLGMCEVDAYLAYRKFCAGKENISHAAFLMDVIAELLDNKMGVSDNAPVLRPRASDVATAVDSTSALHDLRPLRVAPYFVAKAGEDPDNTVKQRGFTCKICRRLCSMYCASCTPPGIVRPKHIVAICNPAAGRTCSLEHQTEYAQGTQQCIARKSFQFRLIALVRHVN